MTLENKINLHRCKFKNKLQHLSNTKHRTVIKDHKLKLSIFIWKVRTDDSAGQHSSVCHWWVLCMSLGKSKLKLRSSSTCCLWNSSSTAASFVLKLAVWVVRVAAQTILPADLIVPCHSLHFPLFSTLSVLLSPPVKSLLISVRPLLTPLAPTATAAAPHSDADDDGPAQHSQGNDQGFKVQPTHSPPGLGQLAHWAWRQQPAHWVVSAVVGAEAPQTLRMWNASVTVFVGGAGSLWWWSCLAFPRANKANIQHNGSKNNTRCLSLRCTRRHR